MPKKAIFVEEKFYRKATFWRDVVGLFFVLGFVIAFWKEIWPVLSLVRFIFGGPPPTVATGQILRGLVILAINVIAVGGSFLLALILISQFMLPVVTSQERSKVFNRLLSYISGTHGPAVFIKEAKEKAREAELRSSRPGVVFVDLCSSVALEKNWVPVSTSGVTTGRSLMRKMPFVKSVRKKLNQMGRDLTRTIGTATRKGTQKSTLKEPLVRVAGPGIVFTEWGERIRGVADLRRQFRVTPRVGVSTRDGFDIQAHVWVLFTLGEPADSFRVTYVDGQEAGNLRVVKVNEKTKTIEGFSDDYDSLDKAEIHQYIRNYQPVTPPATPASDSAKEFSKPPYQFDADRVFAALYSQARNLADGNVVNWADLPCQVAIEIFRDMLSQEDFNNLYKPDDPDTFPFFDSFRPRFSRAVRNQGVLSFQYIQRKDGQLLKKGDVWDETQLDIFPVTRLRSSKVLRDRGVKVIAAGFPELTPKHEGVRAQLVDYWKAKWQSEADLIDADATLEAMRIHAKARAEGQHEMVATLTQLFDMPEGTKEALALRIFQTLEATAADPKTRALLPTDTLNALGNMHYFLFSGEGS